MDTNLYSTELVVTRPEEAPKEKQVTLTHFWTDFKKGDRKKNGEKFPTIAIERTEEGVQHFIKYYGWENTLDTLLAAYNIFSQSSMDTAIEELKKANLQPGTLEFNKAFLERYTRYMTDLETRGETKDELKEAILKLSKELEGISEQQVKAAEACQAAGETPNIKDVMELMRTSKEVKRITDSIKKCNLALAVKARKRKKNVGEEEEETETATAATAQPA